MIEEKMPYKADITDGIKNSPEFDKFMASMDISQYNFIKARLKDGWTQRNFYVLYFCKNNLLFKIILQSSLKDISKSALESVIKRLIYNGEGHGVGSLTGQSA